MNTRTFLAISVLCMFGSTMTYAQESDSDLLEEITVTGSRVVTDGSNAPTPVTAMTAAEMNAAAPSNLPDALNKLPQFTGSFNQNQGGTFNASSEPLGNYLNLRGLDSGRVLTMLNGQRLAPTGSTNAVDANIIPQLLVDRVDIVTGGASAAYGSDAVSGVVNFILDNDFEGIKFDVNAGASSEGDNESLKAAVAGGFALGDRTHVILSGEYYENDGIPSIYDRNFAVGSGRQIGRVGSGTEADPFRTQDWGGWANQSIHRNAQVQDGSSFVAAPAFTQDGALVGPPTPEADLTTFGTPDSGGTSIAGTLETVRFFGKVGFDFTDNIQGHVTAIYSDSETTFNSTPNNTTRANNGYNRSMRVFGDNPFLNPATKAQLGLADDEFIGMTGLYNDIGLVTNVTENEYTSFQVGLRGDISDEWSWDATYNWGESDQSIAFNEFKMKEVWAAMDAVDDGNGNIVCGVTIRNPGFMDDCLPLNVMGAYNYDPAARDYVRADSIKDTTNEMEYINFNIRGDLFELSGGPLSVAFGAEYRTQDLAVISNSDPGYYVNADGTNKYRLFVEDHLGIRGIDQDSLQDVTDYENGVITETELRALLGTGTVPSFTALRYSSVNQGGAIGEQKVTEFYGEANAPLTETFSVNLAARSTDYDTSGQVTTWKAGLSWRPVESVRFRATLSRDIAAPTLTLLFASPDPFFGEFIDLHIQEDANGDGQLIDDQTIVPLYINSGNRDLVPETADTTTIGVVFQPEAVPGLSVSLDYYTIDIEDAFGSLDPVTMGDQCEASNGTASVCDFIVRPLPFDDRTVANAATQILLVPFNLALLETSGIDVEVRYEFDAWGGSLDLRGFLNFVDSYKTQQTVDEASIERVGYTISASPSSGNSLGLPESKGVLMETWSNDSFAISLSQRFTGKHKLGLPGQVWASDDSNIPGGRMPNEIYWDLNASYRFGNEKRYQAYFNVQNLTDVTPPPIPTLAPNLSVPTDKLTYDIIGTTFTLGIRADF